MRQSDYDKCPLTATPLRRVAAIIAQDTLLPRGVSSQFPQIAISQLRLP